jgi:hypothetical protein
MFFSTLVYDSLIEQRKKERERETEKATMTNL